MLDNNTNKVVWVGVAVGVVTLLGLGALQLFPQVVNSAKPSIHRSMLVSSAGASKKSPTQVATIKNANVSGYTAYSRFHAYPWSLPKTGLVVNPSQWAYYGFDIKVGKDSTLKTDINNGSKDYVSGVTSNDNDTIKDREFNVIDENGKSVVDVDSSYNLNHPNHDVAKLKAGKTYHVQIIWHNDTKDILYDGGAGHATTIIMFTPDGGVGNDNPLPINLTNYKQNVY